MKDKQFKRAAKAPKKFADDAKLSTAKVPSKLCMNDPDWYVATPELKQGVASLSFDEWLGRGFKINAANATDIKQATVTEITYYPTFGYSHNEKSAINLCIRNIYTFVRHANSGNKNYTSADMGMYLCATGVAIAYAAHLERILGVAKTYFTRNAVLPVGILDALGVGNISDLRKNLANYTTELNIQWLRLQSLCLPKDFKYIKRWIWLNSQVFKDHSSSKAAMYVFKPIPTYYGATTLTTGGCLHSAIADTNELLFGTLLDHLTTMIDLLLTDEDMRIMSGDILKAYTDSGIIKFGQTPLDYKVEPAFIEEMLPQVHNLHALPVVGSTIVNVCSGIERYVGIRAGATDVAAMQAVFAADIGNIYHYQVDDVLICTPSMGTASDVPVMSSDSDSFGFNQHPCTLPKRILNLFVENPTPDDVLVATRFMFNTWRDTSGNNVDFVVDFATEIVREVRVHYVTENEIAGSDIVSPFSLGLTTSLYFLGLQLDYFPICYAKQNGSGSTLDFTTSIYSVIGDFDNFTIIDDAVIRRLNQSAVYGEFNAPGINYSGQTR